jgi:plastocyanin
MLCLSALAADITSNNAFNREEEMQRLFVQRMLKLGFVGALILGVVAVGLLGNRNVALAQDTEPQTYMVQAGTFTLGNIEILAFGPQELQVHRGDTVMWHFNGFHNVRFDSAPAELIIAPDVDGQPLPQVNPVIAFPTIENGAVYQGGVVGSGVPLDPAAPLTFSLVIDLEPGTYAYVCDIHPGMLGSITVVEDDVAIPTPGEAAAQGAAELDAMNAAAGQAGLEMAVGAQMTPEGDELAITAGSAGPGRATIQQFYSPVGVIHAGQSVTWTVPAESQDPHTVTAVGFEGEDFELIPQEGGPPIIAVGPGLVASIESGSEVGADDIFHSGLLFPGQTYTLTFAEEGVYPYVCHLHAGMQGVIVVEPAM